MSATAHEPARPPIAAALPGALVLRAVVGVALAARVAGVASRELRGVASSRALEVVEVVAGALGYGAAALLVGVAAVACFALARDTRVPVVSRGVVVTLGGLVLAVASPALLVRLEARGAFVLAAAATSVVLAAAPAVLRAAHTRALGIVLLFVGAAGALRTVAHALVLVAGERADGRLFALGRGVSSGGLVLEALGVLVASTYLATRGGLRARFVTNGALVLACVLAYAGARALGDPTPSTAAALLRGLVAVPAPPPLVAGVLGNVLGPAALFLAVVALASRTPGAPALVALVLVARAQPDVPFVAIALAAAAARSVLAAVDGRALWASLGAGRDA